MGCVLIGTDIVCHTSVLSHLVITCVCHVEGFSKVVFPREQTGGAAVGSKGFVGRASGRRDKKFPRPKTGESRLRGGREEP